MTPRRLLLAALGVAASAVPALAGWNHVANVTCNDGPIRRAFRPARDCDEPAPARTPTKVEYETRTYYEPVTVMKAERYTEEVPVQVKSYYWEPVQSYSYRSYYDPCSNECQQIAVPRTSYVRKEECRTETRYLEKVRMVPVQVEREVTETRPVYTYYGPTTRKYGPTTSGPSVDQYRGAPRVEEGRSGGGSTYAPIPGTQLPTRPGDVKLPKKMPEKDIPKIESKGTPSTSDYRFNALSTSFSKETGAKVYGEVLGADQKSPVGNAKLVFVNAGDLNDKKYVTADTFGGFDAKLPAGEWHVYAGPGNGTANYISKFKVKDGEQLPPLGVVVK
jgi:hypothetical protein